MLGIPCVVNVEKGPGIKILDPGKGNLLGGVSRPCIQPKEFMFVFFSSLKIWEGMNAEDCDFRVRQLAELGAILTTLTPRFLKPAEGILLQSYRDANGSCIAVLFARLAVRSWCNSSYEQPQPIQWIAFPVEFPCKAFIHWMPCPLSVTRAFLRWLLLRHIPCPKVGFDPLAAQQLTHSKHVFDGYHGPRNYYVNNSQGNNLCNCNCNLTAKIIL